MSRRCATRVRLPSHSRMVRAMRSRSIEARVPPSCPPSSPPSPPPSPPRGERLVSIGRISILSSSPRGG